MDLFGRSLDHEVAVIAEIGVNHEGDESAALALVDAVAATGADAIKFQSYTPWRYASANDPDRLARVTRFALDKATHRRLAERAAGKGLAFLSTPLTEDWVDLLAEIGSAIKVASGDLTFEPTIRAAAASGRPVLLSTGLGTLDEIDRAVGWVRDEVGAEALATSLVLLHCVVAYPTPLDEANVSCIPMLRERYGVHVGWSNHVIGSDACLAAAALGAPVVEVHVTDRREGRTFRDHELSFEPDELADLVVGVRRMRAAVGSPTKERTPSESGLVDAVRKGVVAARDLTAGTRLTRADLAFARPATEFVALDVDRLVGAELLSDLTAGSLVPRAGVTLAEGR